MSHRLAAGSRPASSLIVVLALFALALAAGAPRAAAQDFTTALGAPGKPVDRFANRTEIGVQGLALAQPPADLEAGSIGDSGYESLLGSVDLERRLVDGVQTTGVKGTGTGLSFSATTKVRPALAAGSITTVDGMPGGEDERRDSSVLAHARAEGADGPLRVCLKTSNGLDACDPATDVRPGTNLGLALGDFLAGPDRRALAVSWVDRATGDVRLRLWRQSGGQVVGPVRGTLAPLGATLTTYSASTLDAFGTEVGPATDTRVVAADLDGDGRDSAVVTGGSRDRQEQRAFLRGAWTHTEVEDGAVRRRYRASNDTLVDIARGIDNGAPTVLAQRVPALYGSGARPARDVLVALTSVDQRDDQADALVILDVLEVRGDDLRDDEDGLALPLVAQQLQAVTARDTNNDATEDLYVAAQHRTRPNDADLLVVRLAQSSTGAVTLSASDKITLPGSADGFTLAAVDSRPLPENTPQADCPTGIDCQRFFPRNGQGARDADVAVLGRSVAAGAGREVRFRVASLPPAAPDAVDTGFSPTTTTFVNDTRYLFPATRASGTATTGAGAPLLARGSFRDRLEIGTPSLRVRQRIEPLVVLNSPPAHLDVIDDKRLDVNTCHFVDFVSGECEFFSQYTDRQTTANSVSTTVKEDYAVSTTAEAGGVIPIGPVSVNLSASLTASIGGQAIASDQTERSTTVEVNVKAQDDDQVYLTTKRYDMLEYPVYAAGRGEPVTYFLAVTPTITNKRWVSANGSFAQQYRNPHETGNILSYPPEPTPEFNAGIIDSPDYGTFGETQFEVTRTSDFTYGVTQSDITTQSKETSFSAGFEATVKAGVEFGNRADGEAGVGASLSVTGGYDREDLQTSTTSVGSELSLLAKLGRISAANGRSSFLVRPFAYLSQPTDDAPGGALVVDYAVTPDQATDGTETFWQTQYGRRPDLTFNLPHRLDPARGIVPASESERYGTKSVGFRAGACDAPEEPTSTRYPVPGSRICLTAAIENYSLRTSQAPAVVRFFLGDPGAGGRPIGQATVAGPIVARGTVADKARQTAELSWTVPGALRGQIGRIWAVVDADGGATEVHEENNRGWFPLEVFSSTDTTEPAQVGIVDATRTDGDLVVTFERPTGQRAGTTYEVRAFPYDSEARRIDPDGTLVGTAPAGPDGSLADVRPLAAALPDGAYVVAVVPVAAGLRGPVSYPSEPVGITPGAPSQPRNVSATAGDTRALVTWSGPTSDGGDPVRSFQVRVLDAASEELLRTTTVDGTVNRLDVDGLANGRAIVFEVTAVNGRGSGPPSLRSSPVTPSGAPDVPVGTTATAVAGGLADVVWEEPDTDGGSPVTGYEVSRAPGGVVATLPADARTFRDSGLVAGQTYRYRVVARNVRGASAPSTDAPPIVAFDRPPAPEGVAARAGDRRLVVSWSPPAADNGRPVTTYRVRIEPGGFEQATGADTRSVTFEGLSNGTPYVATVVAENAAGAGPGASAPATAPSDGVAAPGPASAPQGVRVEAGDRALVVRWSTPATDGGSAVQGYDVVLEPGGVRAVGPEVRELLVDGLANGTAYVVAVRARTAAGVGVASDAVTAQPSAPPRAPGAPTGVTATPGDRSAAVAWSAADGAAVTGYEVRSSPGDVRRTVAADARAATVKGLTNGVSYTFTVRALDREVAGAASQPSNPVVPRTVPGAPQDVLATPADGAAVVRWAPPAQDGGMPVTSYTVVAEPGGSRASVTAGDTSTRVDGLAADRAYRFRVVARNAAGEGPPSDLSAAVRPTVGVQGSGVPGAPGAPGVPGVAGAPGTSTGVEGAGGLVYAGPDSVLNGPERFPVGITVQCSIDGGPFGACELPLAVGTLAPGEHTIVLRPVDRSIPAETIRVVVDPSVPVAGMGPLGRYTSRPSVWPQVAARTNRGGVERLEVRVRRATRTGRFGPYQVRALTAGATRTEVVMAAGTTACTSVRAVGTDGRVSTWTGEQCISRTLGATALQRAQAGRRFRVGGDQRAVDVRTGALRRVVVVLGAPRGGTVTVRVGSVVRRVRGAATRRRSVAVTVPVTARGGMLRVRTSSARILAVAAERRP
jgi:hypothetical protein